MSTDAGTPTLSDPLAIMSPIDALRRVAKLVKTTQPTWSNHLTTVCDAHEAAQSKLAALIEAHNNLRADYTKLCNECDRLREDAERLTFFMDQSGQFYEEGYNYFVTGASQEYIDAARKAK